MTDSRRNPLLDLGGLPDYAAIRPEHVRPAVEAALADARSAIAGLEREAAPGAGWLERFELVKERVRQVWAPVEHLNSVTSSPALRDAFNETLPLITGFWTELGQNAGLYAAFRRLEADADALSAIETRIVALSLRDFRLAGVALEEADRARFRDVMLALSEKQAAFEQNLLDATDAFGYHETDPDRLAGLPRIVLDRARQAAADAGKDGFVLRLDMPTYQAVVTHADDDALRERYYRAWVTRASDQAEDGERFDNAGLIDEILALRAEAAALLGFADYAEYSLATKMAPSADDVIGFLENLGARSRPVAARELGELAEFAGRSLAAWDVPYYAEKLKQQRFELSEEALRPYFPVPRVIGGLFELAKRLFDIELTPVDDVPVWHDSVRYHAIRRGDGREVGGLYTDLYARPNKRGGAWMDVCLNRAALGPDRQLPVAHLVCNFGAPVNDTPALLTHVEVVTLFHEFGHTLHHLLTEIDYPSIAGINNVAWDAVELPSQFFENYAWLPEVLGRITGHYETGEPLPESKIETMNRSRRYMAGLAMVRQLEFALFDFRLHRSSEPPRGAAVLALLDAVRRDVAVVEQPAYNRFPSSFSHIFGGGYSAGYYSYKWAEVLAADAFAAFAETGAFDAATADRFRRSVLAVGGSKDALDAFVDFRGREPNIDALLEQSGITGAAA